MNKSIYIFSQSLLSGGAEKQSVLLARELCKFYNTSFIIYYEKRVDNKLLEQLVNSNINVQVLQGNFIKKGIRLLQLFKKNKNAVLFNYLLLPNLLGGIAASITGIYSFGGIRSSVLENKKGILNKFAHNYINDKTIFNNCAGKEICTALGFKESKSIVIPNGIEIPELITNKKNILPIIISVGRFEKVKDYNTSLKAIFELKKNNIKFEYWIIGWGSLENEIKNIIQKLSLSNDVKMFVNPDNVNELYRKSDIYLQTSLFEGLSNTVMEAMSYSLPCVVTDVGDNNQLIHNQKTGYLCNIGDYKDISKKLEMLITDHGQRANLGINAYNHIKENYSTERLRTNYINLINSIGES